MSNKFAVGDKVKFDGVFGTIIAMKDGDLAVSRDVQDGLWLVASDECEPYQPPAEKCEISPPIAYVGSARLNSLIDWSHSVEARLEKLEEEKKEILMSFRSKS